MRKQANPDDIDESLLREIASRKNITGSALDYLESEPQDKACPVCVDPIPNRGGGERGEYEKTFLQKKIVSDRTAVYISRVTKSKITEVVQRLA